MLLLLLLQGVLVTFRGDVELGRERFRDDGQALVSEVTMNGRTVTVTLPHDPTAKVRVETAGQVIERERPAGTVVLETGAWQEYAVVAKTYAAARSPTPVKVLIPSTGALVAGTVQVSNRF